MPGFRVAPGGPETRLKVRVLAGRSASVAVLVAITLTKKLLVALPIGDAVVTYFGGPTRRIAVRRGEIHASSFGRAELRPGTFALRRAGDGARMRPPGWFAQPVDHSRLDAG
ncbi:hypothetical protein LBMAG56_08690 [Verrucomicrobiota bacterium]|nr:hypothetical protein LBMAG56_08690 [Verrucomicrobiota bacterium]